MGIECNEPRCKEMSDRFDEFGQPWCGKHFKTASKQDLATSSVTIKQSELNRLAYQLNELRNVIEPFATFANALPPIIEGTPRLTDHGPAFTAAPLGQNHVISFWHLRQAKAVLGRLKEEDIERWVRLAEMEMTRPSGMEEEERSKERFAELKAAADRAQASRSAYLGVPKEKGAESALDEQVEEAIAKYRHTTATKAKP